MDTRYHSLKDLLEHPGFREGEHWRRWSLGAHQIVFKEGERGSEIYVVLSGTLMVCTDVALDAAHHLQPGICELFDGEEFAQSCFFDDKPHCATVKTLTPCELAAIDAARLKDFLDQRPEIGYRILSHWIEHLIPRLRQSNKRISSLFGWGLKAHKIDADLQ